MNLNDIIDGCVRNDASCQRLLYEQYKDAMFTLCVRLCHSNEEAQDAFQEAFIDVFSMISTFRKEATIGAWMKTIFTRRAYKSYHQKIWLEDIADINETELIDWGIEINTEHLELALKQLPHGFRMVLVLIELEGYKHREVAEMLNISVGTVKSQLFHAKRKLKDLLLKMEADERI